MNLKALVPAGVLVLSIAAGSVAAWADDDRSNHKSPTRGFFAFPRGGNDWASVLLGTEFTEIQRFASLPPGRYIANASAVLGSVDSTAHIVDCQFTIGGALQGEVAQGFVGGTLLTGAPFGRVTLPLTFGFRIDAPQDLGIACRSEVGDVVFSQPSPITAISVDRLTVKTGFLPEE